MQIGRMGVTHLRSSSELPRISAFGVCPGRAFAVSVGLEDCARLDRFCRYCYSAFLFFCDSAGALARLTRRERVILADRIF